MSETLTGNNSLSATSLIMEDVQDSLVRLVGNGELEQDAQSEIQDIIREWFGEDQPDHIVEELAKGITGAALECLHVEVTFNPNANLVEIVRHAQSQLNLIGK
jgi:hypothetical protein